ncbi:hypothetical protein CLF_103820 [Clonorchis sinensis]|uniref:Uncharacterized protein n=1 Tax=Clonorchis sinensis TaxID=79923 RepID=G7YAG5_CLOSI|nr:hypothetical protein CLF_103820 [Clonorchis sinensis]
MSRKFAVNASREHQTGINVRVSGKFNSCFNGPEVEVAEYPARKRVMRMAFLNMVYSKMFNSVFA